MGDIANSQDVFDLRDLRYSVLETVFAKLLVLDFLEEVAHFVKLMGRERFLPCREYDRVFASRMVLIHELHAIQNLR